MHPARDRERERERERKEEEERVEAEVEVEAEERDAVCARLRERLERIRRGEMRRRRRGGRATGARIFVGRLSAVLPPSPVLPF